MRSLTSLLALSWVALSGVAGAAAQAPAPQAAPAPGVFELESLNHRYERLAPDLIPFTSGPFTVALSSPEHQLDLRFNRIVLRPQEKGVYGLALQLEFAGQGRLIADLTVAGSQSRFEDLLTVPAQRRTVLGTVRIARSKSGYLVTPTTLPETFGIEIESRIGQQLVGACKSLAMLGLGGSCDDLERAFSLVQVPLPAPGETYLVESSRLSVAERQKLDAFLTQTGAIFLAQ
jgi:hypothetical protein